MDREIDIGTRRTELAYRVARWLGVAACCVVALVVVRSWATPSVNRTEIRTEIVERGSVRAGFEASGEVAPALERAISSPVDARVVSVLRRPGDLLEAGDEILRLDTSDSRLELDRVSEQIQQKSLERSRMVLATTTDLADIRSKIAQKDLDLELLESRLEQNRLLYEEGLVSSAVLRQAEVEAQKARLELADLHRSVQTLETNRRSELAAIDSSISTLQREKTRAERELELARTRAVERGVLTWVTPQEGVTVREGEVIARVADLSSFQILGTVSDIHAAKLTTGLAVDARVGDRWLEGRVASVDPTIENGVARFVVELVDSSDAMLRNKMRVDLQVITATKNDVLSLQRGPHLSEARTQDVFVIDDQRAVRREVTFGLVSARELEIVEGLDEGDEVIVSDMRDRLSLEAIAVD